MIKQIRLVSMVKLNQMQKFSHSVEKPSSTCTEKFRKKYNCDAKQITNWFPGHMNTGLKDMQRKLRTIDCIVEVHDARIPLHGRNRNFYSFLTAIKPHVLVLNKVDLSEYVRNKKDQETLGQEIWDSHNYDSQIHKIIFTNAKKPNDTGMIKLVPTIIDAIKNSDRFHRQDVLEYLVMVIGVPNVGKSSIINALRSKYIKKGKATRVGALAGVTQSVLERIKICMEPPIYVLDTPGIMAPNMKNFETALRLAVCGTFKDHLVGELLIADYLLYWLNKNQNFSYVPYLGLNEPSDNIDEVLIKAAIAMDKKIAVRSLDGSGQLIIRPNTSEIAQEFIKAFRKGSFGPINFT